MRRSGLRIGELLALEPGCLEYNLRGDTFLKVPLGKLDNERLVPLDDSTRKLVETLHAQHRPDVPFLISPPRRRATIASRMRATLREAASGLGIPGRIVPHRLRHTYATELLNGGMPLVTLMKLLGHRSLHMTMGYAALSQTTVVDEYRDAMAQIAGRYEVPAQLGVSGDADPQRLVLDTISCLRNHAPDQALAQRLIKRLYKLHTDIAPLTNRDRTE